MAEAKKVTAEFTKHKETKGTWQYAEDDENNPIMGSFYLKRTQLEKLGSPNRVRVTIETIDG